MRFGIRRVEGYTLVELLVTAVIVSILALSAFPAAELALRRSKEHELRRSLITIRSALDAYKQAYDEGRITPVHETSGYPPSLETLVEGIPDAKDVNGAKIYFLRRLPRDPFSTDLNAPAASTWATRSYVSSAQQPKEGKDVFDVFSRSDEIGINGVPYLEW